MESMLGINAGNRSSNGMLGYLAVAQITKSILEGRDDTDYCRSSRFMDAQSKYLRQIFQYFWTLGIWNLVINELAVHHQSKSH